MKIACSYNPMFLDDVTLIDLDTELIELGIEAYCQIFSEQSNRLSQFYTNSLSLHIARSPITEDCSYQNIFIQEKLTPIIADNKVISIGFYLSESRYENIGKFGLTSHYKASKIAESNCIRFINQVESLTKKEVWIENANFYSKNIVEIIDNWRSVVRILENSNTRLIIDITHLVIDCTNIGISPDIFLGCIPWDKVAEIHLSGIVEGGDGTLHDGHSNEVDFRSWGLFKKVLELNLLNDNTFINIEHSESSWINNIEIYQKDFYYLKLLISNYHKLHIISEKYDNSEKYAISFIKKTIYSNISNYKNICQALGKSEEDVFNQWMSYVFSKYRRISLSKSEIDSMIQKDCIYIIESSIEFLENRQ